MSRLITLEGGEGCGKSTQAQYLYDWLTQIQIPVALTREPGGTPLGTRLRSLLLESGEGPTTMAELMLYAADRAEHVERVIRPALAGGTVVVCDRFIDSTVAYQGYGRGLDLDAIDQLNALATGGLVPDLTLWLDLDPVIGLARRPDPDRLEAAGLAFHRRVYAGFAAQAARYNRIRAIRADQSISDVTEQIRATVAILLD